MANPRKESIEIEAKVLKALPDTKFKVVLVNGHEILAHTSGKVRKNRIRIIPGDKVLVELSPYDLTMGRITYRLNENQVR